MNKSKRYLEKPQQRSVKPINEVNQTIIQAHDPKLADMFVAPSMIIRTLVKEYQNTRMNSVSERYISLLLHLSNIANQQKTAKLQATAAAMPPIMIALCGGIYTLTRDQNASEKLENAKKEAQAAKEDLRLANEKTEELKEENNKLQQHLSAMLKSNKNTEYTHRPLSHKYSSCNIM